MSLVMNRIDARLIHGQITTGWIARCGADAIVIMDQQIANDPFMEQVFKMAAPPSVKKLWTFTTDKAAEEWQKDEFDSLGQVMLLTRNVPTIYEAYQKGFKFPELLVGGIGGAAGRKNVHGPITLNDEDAKMLIELQEDGVHIWFQSNVDEPRGEWTTIRAKHYPNM